MTYEMRSGGAEPGGGWEPSAPASGYCSLTTDSVISVTCRIVHPLIFFDGGGSVSSSSSITPPSVIQPVEAVPVTMSLAYCMTRTAIEASESAFGSSTLTLSSA